jgi:membrane protease YdiL (CAAX protease family)
MFSLLSAYLRMGSTRSRLGHLFLYSIAIAFDWVLFAFILWKSDSAFARYVARVFQDPRSLLLDIPVAVLLSGATLSIAPLIVRVLGQAGWVSLEGMRPNNGLEIAAWIVAAISAGICEETIFRGYLQQQLSGWAGRLSVGVLGQAAIFGLAHGYQGWKNMTLIFVLGGIFGAFVRLRKGLRANMIAHAGMDILAAF